MANNKKIKNNKKKESVDKTPTLRPKQILKVKKHVC